MNTIRRILIFSGIFFVLYLLFFPVSVSMERVLPAVEIAMDDPAFCQTAEVTVEGVYHWRLLGKDTFTGNIRFDAYPLTQELDLTQTDTVPALTFGDGGTDLLEYGPWMDSLMFGHLTSSPFLRRFAVQVLVPSEDGRGGAWSTEDGHCIVVPATSRQEALSVLKRLGGDTLPPYEYWVDGESLSN